MAQAYTFANLAELNAAIALLPVPDPNEATCAGITNQVQQRQGYVQLFPFRTAILRMSLSTDPTEPAVGEANIRYKRAADSAQAEIDPVAAVPPLAALTGIRPKQPTVTKCNLSGNKVQLFLTSMTTACSTFTFVNDK